MDTNIKEILLDDLVQSVVKAKLAIEELEAGEKMLKDEIGDRLRAMKISGTKSGNYLVSLVKRISFPDVPLSKASELGATVVKKDETKLRKLLDKGVKIKHSVTQYVFVKESKNE